MTELKHRCGECARFKVPDSGCPHYDDFFEFVDGRSLTDMTAKSPACSNFYPGSSNKKMEIKQPAPHSSCGLAQEGYYEAIYHCGKPAFLVKTGDGFKVLETVTRDGKELGAKEFPDECPYEPYGVYEDAIPNREDLFWKVRAEFNLFLDVESCYKDLLAACVLLSYQQEKLKAVPYVYFYGDNESGKTVALDLLSLLCYRAMHGVTIPEADMYGYLDDSDAPGTIIEDEIQGIWKDLNKSKIYKAGYKKGAVVPRTFILQHKRFIKYFRCFCFKGCAAEELIRVKGLSERFIPIHMVQGYPDKDWADANEEDLKRIRELRNVLLKWRLASVNWQLPDVELSVKGRLKELFKPIIQVVQGLTVEKDLRSFMGQLQQERLNEKMNSKEGHLVKVVSELYRKDQALEFTDIWEALTSDLSGKLDDKKPNQMDTPEFGILTKQWTGYRLREILAGQKKSLRTKDGFTKVYEFDYEKLGRIVRKYGFNIVSKCPSLLTPRGVTTEENAGKAHEKPLLGMEESPEKLADTSQELDKLRHLDTNVEDPCSDDPAAPTMKNESTPILETETPTVKNQVKANSVSVQEVLERIRSVFVEGTEEEWLSLATENGLSQQEAARLFESLNGEQLFWFDREGKTYWRWVTS
jgi:hypothetical protein